MASDLHIHTLYSDGTFTPTEVIRYAEECSLSYISITDHDVLDGYREIKNIKSKVKVIPGIEIECKGKGNVEEIHILGYFIDIEKKELLDFLLFMRDGEEERIRTIVQKLQKGGIDIEYPDVERVGKPGSIRRLHIAKVLFDKGLGDSVMFCFNKYLSFGKCGFVPKEHLSEPEEVINIIKEANGIPILAHPYDTIGTLKDLIQLGVMGIEIIHPKINYNFSIFLKRKAEEYGLLITGGSDCHGKMKGEEILGKLTIDDIEIERFLLFDKKNA